MIRTNKEHTLAMIDESLASGKFCQQLQDEVTAIRDAVNDTSSDAAISRWVTKLIITLNAHACNDHN